MRSLAKTLVAAILLAGYARADSAQNASSSARCAAGADRPECWYVRTGSLSAEDIARTGDELFRFHIEGFRTPESVYELRREPSGDVLLDMRVMRRGHGEIAYPVPQSVWDHVIARWKRFEREEDAFIAGEAKRKAEQNEEEKRTGVRTVTVCTDGYSIDFDTVLDGKVAHRSPETCAHPLTDDLREELPAYLLSQVPFCARIREVWRQACFFLEGNMYEAADVVDPVLSLAGFDCDKGDSAELDSAFAPGARVSVDGERWAEGAIASRLRAMLCENPRRFIALSIVEGRPDAVVVTATVSYDQKGVSGDLDLFEAPSRQVWIRGEGGKYRIVSWDVGKFARFGVN